MLRRVLGLRVAAVVLTAILSASTLATTAAAAAPRTATDWFVGTALTGSGQASPVQINPSNVTVRADGATGLGYMYQAAGFASGQVPGAFTYEEHGYLYFQNPSDPTTMVGSKFSSGVFTLRPAGGGAAVRIADTAPEAYTSGVQTVVRKLAPQLRKAANTLLGTAGPLTYGYFTFTNAHGTYTGYATPDFTRFAIQITFDLP